jgi:mono/diheme cytochrome c family protein
MTAARMLRGALAGGVWLALALTTAPSAALDATAASAGVYSADQAERGSHLYSAHCAACHGPALEGVDVAPPLSGTTFLSNWTGQTVGALAKRIRTTMPLDEPGRLGVGATADIVAYILDVNGYPAGAAALPGAGAPAEQIRLDPPSP